MSRIVDRRNTGGAASAGNRKKFIDRYKKNIADSIKRTIERTKIKDISKNRKVTIPPDGLSEPTFAHSPDTGRRDKVMPGNKKYTKGQKLPRPEQGEGKGGRGAGNGGEGEDDFEFLLTKDEFLNLLFEDMKLPNYVKESIKCDFKTRRIRSGYTTEGALSQLNVLKTFEMALGRRISHRGAINKKIEEATTPEEIEELKKRKPMFLDDIDLRYNNYRQVKYPIRKAVMFCILDVSGSMTEDLKDLAKRYFLLLYLFLEKQYDNIEVRFIKHTTVAKEVDEEDFFYSKESGGTYVSPAFDLINSIIEEEYDVAKHNIYISQASDGDNWGDDNEKLLNVLENTILPKVQYLAYMQVGKAMTEAEMKYITQYYGMQPLFSVYHPLVQKYKHFNQGCAETKDQIFPVLRGLFKDGE